MPPPDRLPVGGVEKLFEFPEGAGRCVEILGCKVPADFTSQCFFYRLRIGIGHPGEASRVTGYVLGKPTAEDRARIDASIEEAISALPLLLEGDDTKAMTRLHSFTAD